MIISFRKFLTLIEEHLLNEQISTSELQVLAQQVIDSIGGADPLVNATICRNITKNPQIIKLNPKTSAEEGDSGLPSNFVKNLATNYKFYFGKIAEKFQHAEAVLFEFQPADRQTFIIYLGFLPNGKKLAAFAVPPYYYIQKKSISTSIPKITNILRQWGFKVHVQGNKEEEEELATENQDLEFLNKLIGIFRYVSSRDFDFQKKSWDRVKQEYHQLQKEMPEAYVNYRKKLQKAYPNGIIARRKIDLKPNTQILTVDSGKMPINEVIEQNIKVYYPNRLDKDDSLHFPMSQWSEDAINPKHMDTAYGGGGYGTLPYIFRGKIPINEIVYSQRILPTGLSQFKVEAEIIVDHVPNGGTIPAYDENIICTVVEMGEHKWDIEQQDY